MHIEAILMFAFSWDAIGLDLLSGRESRGGVVSLPSSIKAQ